VEKSVGIATDSDPRPAALTVQLNRRFAGATVTREFPGAGLQIGFLPMWIVDRARSTP